MIVFIDLRDMTYANNPYVTKINIEFCGHVRVIVADLKLLPTRYIFFRIVNLSLNKFKLKYIFMIMIKK